MVSNEFLPREWMRGPQFAGDEARRVWAPTLRSAQEAWGVIELVSVSEGKRPSALVYLTPDEFMQATRDASRVGLSVLPLSMVNGSYRCAVTPLQYAQHWYSAWAEGNDELIGQLLGFPKCCRDSFQKIWVEKRVSDQAPYCGAFTGPWESNILFRHLGVRLVPHLPCAGDCAETFRQAREYLEAGRRAGADVDSIEKVLKLGVKYDALNGVAIVDAGPFRFMHGTDVTGVLTRPSEFTRPSEPPSFALNGFYTQAGMDAAHEAIRYAFSIERAHDSVLDLGAGDGALLNSLTDGVKVAVEQNEATVAAGRKAFPKVSFFQGTNEEYLEARAGEPPFDVCLLMPGRILELPEERRAPFVARLKQAAKLILVYSYGDEWINQFKGLAGLCAAAGLVVDTDTIRATKAAQTGWLR